MSDERDNKLKDPDIANLLAAALDDEPSPGFRKRVMNQLAGLKTAIEFGRLVGVAPIHTFLDGTRDEDDQDDQDDQDDEDDNDGSDGDEGDANDDQ